MHLFGEDLICDEANEEGSGSAAKNVIMDEQDPTNDEGQGSNRRFANRRHSDSEPDEEWSTPLAKISRLVFDHESWLNAKEILEVPSAACRKVGDEARSLAARHIIDRLREKEYLEKIQKVAPRLRSAVELLSKPDADYVYPPFRFVVNQLRERHPEIYTSVVRNVGLRIPYDMKPKTMLVSMAKFVVENPKGETTLDWGKFTALLGLCGALAIDSVEANYSEGVAEIVDTFGLIVEQVMGEWILSDKSGGGWDGFIRANHYDPILSPIPRTMIILIVGFLFLLLIARFVYSTWALFMFVPSGERDFWGKWGNVYPTRYCSTLDSPESTNGVCNRPITPVEFLYMAYADS